MKTNEPGECMLGEDDLLAAMATRVREDDTHGNARDQMAEIRSNWGLADDQLEYLRCPASVGTGLFSRFVRQ